MASSWRSVASRFVLSSEYAAFVMPIYAQKSTAIPLVIIDALVDVFHLPILILDLRRASAGRTRVVRVSRPANPATCR
jgi:hypothetical protein